MLGRVIKRLYTYVCRFFLLRRLRKRRVILLKGCSFASTEFESPNFAGYGTCITRSEVGKYSYLGNNCNFDQVKIGRFCSIGDNVQVIAAQHPSTGFVSTSPVFYDRHSNVGSFTSGQQLFDNYRYVSGTSYKVVIGNDVWIGSNSLIIGGVKIGTGAIIAASAVVTKDVEPFSIVGGVPAKFIKYRFEGKQINTIIQSEWWNQTDEWLSSHIETMKNIEIFCLENDQDINTNNSK